MGGGGSSSSVVGYKYYMGLHIQACLGGADEFLGIVAGEKTAWEGAVTGNTQIYLDVPDLFGGDKKEGGLQGYVDVEFGREDQARNDYLLAQLGGDIPAFRGVFGLVCRKIYCCATSPYMKAWWLKLRRQPAAHWYAATCNINDGSANPAHIIYECMTSEIWGMGCGPGLMNDDKFKAAADTLHAEGFGLSLKLTKPSAVEDFILDICRHIQAVTGFDHDDGTIYLKLIRDDYDADVIPEFRTDDGTLLGVDKFARPSPGEIVNQINLTYCVRGETDTTTITGHNLASIQAQGAVIQDDVDYDGIDSDALAAQVLARDLQNYASNLASVTARLNRSAWALLVGDVCKLTWDDPNLGTIIIIVRVMEIDYGTLDDGIITINGTQDVFSLDEYLVVAPQPTEWENPITAPIPMVHHGVMELTYWDLVRLAPEKINYLDASYGYLQYFGILPARSNYSFDFYVKAAGGSYAFTATGSLCPSASLAGDIGYTDTDIAISSASFSTGSLPDEDTYALIDDELIRIDEIDTTANTMIIGRGCLDTVCAGHGGGTVIFCVEAFRAVSETTYLFNQAVIGEGRTRTSIGVLNTDDAPDDTLTITARQDKPYPPGLFRLNGTAYPGSIDGALTISWAHRDRTQQTVSVIDESAGNIGPETGATCSLSLYDETGTLIKEETSLTGTSYTWTNEAADTGLIRLNTQVRVRLWSVREGVDSFQKHDVITTRRYPMCSVLPTITAQGTNPGETLTGNDGTWVNNPTLTGQWYRDGVAIDDATSGTYTIMAVDQGRNLTWRVTGTNDAGTREAESTAMAIPAA